MPPERSADDWTRYFNEEVWGKRNVTAVDDLIADDFIEHTSLAPEPVRGPEGARESVQTMLVAFPDAAVELEDVIAEDDRVAIRARATGTHEGELMGIEPTGNRIELSVMAIQQVRDGQAVAEWQLIDRLDLLAQLGVIELPVN